jgi:hypothetical protein
VRQIPSEGEFCGVDCPVRLDNICRLYTTTLVFDPPGAKRCNLCLKDKPQVLTEEERTAIYVRAIETYGGHP